MLAAMSDGRGRIDQLNAQLTGINMGKQRDQEKLERIHGDVREFRKGLRKLLESI